MKWRCRHKVIDLTRPVVMGILNVTPDSFSDGDRYATVDAALARARRMEEEGAVIIDVGGESTRPGAEGVDEGVEIARVVPVIEAIAANCEIAISVDTSKPKVMAAAVAAGLIHFAAVGPALTRPPQLRVSNAILAWRDPALRLANLGYLGHMWELYAMWAWIGAFLAASFQQRYGDAPPVSPMLATFAVIAVGALGALGGGWAADRAGRTAVTAACMGVSGCCALGIGLLFGQPAWAVLALGLLWGLTVVADSAQFSAAVTELSERGLVGTMLTVQTCAGFLLTIVSIQALPYVQAAVGWRYAFAVLAIGPFLGAWAMLRLRSQPQAAVLAGGCR